MTPVTCELSRFSNAVETCTAPATHVVTASHPDDPPAAAPDTYELCQAHAAGALKQQHRHPRVSGESISVTPGVA